MRSLKVGPRKQVSGEFYGTPKEIWAFKVPRARGRSVEIGRRFLADNTKLFGLDGIPHRSIEHVKTIHSLGATHVIFRQRHATRRIHRAFLTVHIGRNGRVFLAKNRAVPVRFLPDVSPFHIQKADARRIARRALRGNRGLVRVVGAVEEVWFPKRTRLRPAYKVRLHSVRPREEWIIYVDAERRRVLEKYDNLAFASGLASIFDPNPVVTLNEWRSLRLKKGRVKQPPVQAFKLVELTELAGNGRLDGRHVTTRPTRNRVRRDDLRFVFTSTEPGFEEAMAYFHIGSVITYLESLGYTGARRIFTKPVPVNARGTREDNSWYSPGTKSLTFGTGGVDDAEDAEIIVHEFGHAIQDAICPDFGQSTQAAAMGEGFGDYLAASFFEHTKPAGMRSRVMAWDAIADQATTRRSYVAWTSASRSVPSVNAAIVMTTG